MQLLALPDVVYACVIHLICLADRPVVRARHRCVLRLVRRLMIVRAAHVLARQVLGLIERASLGLSVQQSAQLRGR